jgi:hypothetical protein
MVHAGSRSAGNQEDIEQGSSSHSTEPRRSMANCLIQKVLYLMIVNMPTDEEMVEAHDIAAQVQAHVNGQA